MGADMTSPVALYLPLWARLNAPGLNTGTADWKIFDLHHVYTALDFNTKSEPGPFQLILILIFIFAFYFH